MKEGGDINYTKTVFKDLINLGYEIKNIQDLYFLFIPK